MKKITYCLAILLLAIFQSNAQVELGDGSSVNKHVPFEPASDYSYAQSIYLASEINASGNITSLQWYFNGFGLDNSQSLTIYLGHTSKNTFASKTDWEPIANLTQVYSGGITTTTGQEFVSIQFDTPFAYNGTDNLVVAVRETAVGSDGSDADFYATQVSGNRSLSYYSNITVPDPASPGTASTIAAYVPNVVIGGITQLCPKPIDLSVADITETTATLSWTSVAANPIGGMQYYISQTATNPTPLTDPTGSVASGNFAQITTGLNPATTYHVWVRDVCEAGPGVWSGAALFITQCEAGTLINENFDTGSGSLPLCWSAILNGPAVTQYTSVATSSSYPHSGNRSVEFYKDNLASTELTLVSPKLSNIASHTHRLKFFARNDGATTVKVGTLDGNGPDANFTPFQTIPVTNSFAEYTVDFTSYGDGEDSFIGIRLLSVTGETSGLFVDDIRWEVAPPCPDVTNVAIGVVTPETASVIWTAADDETHWDVAFAPSTVTDTSGLVPAVSATDDATATISGLTPNTSYNVWVRSVCDVEPQVGNGIWVGPVTFTTACTAVNDFYENFDTTSYPNVPECWSSILRGSISYASVGVNVNNSHSGPNSVALTSGFGPGQRDVILVSPYLGNLSGGGHRLRFFAKGIGQIEVGTLTSNTNAASFSPLGDLIQTTDDSQEFTVDFSSYTETDKFIGIRLYTSTYTTVYLDDIRWELLPACPDVADISFSGITPETAVVGWSEGTENGLHWQVAYGSASVTDPDSLIPSALLASGSFEITGLTANTTYNVWVRTVCGGTDGNGVWSNVKSFTTACSAVTDFTETFDEVSSAALPGCWSTIFSGENVSGSISIATFQPYSGANLLEMSNAGSPPASDIILVSPALSNLSMGGHQLKFFAHNAGSDANLQIGTVSGANGDESFSPITGGDVTLTGTYEEYTVDFSAYDGLDTHIGIRFNGTSPYTSVNIDNIVWEAVPLCGEVVTDIAADAITTTTANLTWASEGSESHWQFVYGENSVSDPNQLEASALLDVKNAALSGLTPSTTYKVWVRSVCGPDANGVWIGPITFNTACEAANVPYTEDFESALLPSLPNCSSTDTPEGNINWTTFNNPGSGFSGKVLSYEALGSEVPADAWFFTQGVNLEFGANYSISYKYGNNSGLVESLEVKYGTSNNGADMTIELADHPEVTGGTPQNNTVNFTPPATGVYYFGFHAYSAANQWQLLVDNIVVSPVLSNGGFDDEGFTYYPNPVKNVLNLDYKQTISTVSVFNLLGQKVIEKTIGSTSGQIDMSPLSAGSYIVKVSSENQTKTLKVIKE